MASTGSSGGLARGSLPFALGLLCVVAGYALWYVTGTEPGAPEGPELVAYVIPPLGVWRASSLTGEIQVEAGGSAVLCQQGNAHRPATRRSKGFTATLRLEGPSSGDVDPAEPPLQGVLFFELAFVRGDDLDVFSNMRSAPIPSQGQHPVGSPAQATKYGSWSWSDRSLHGVVSARQDPADTSGASPELTFEIQGSFETPTRASGSWSFREVAGLGACWSRAQGSGEWTAEFVRPEGSAATDGVEAE